MRATPLFALLGILAFAALPLAVNAIEANAIEACLDDPNWAPGKLSESDREKLLEGWLRVEQQEVDDVAQVERLYGQLGDECYEIRAAASEALLWLGRTRTEVLLGLTKGDNDVERTSRAKAIVEEWRRRQTIRLRNVTEIWLDAPDWLQIKYARELVDAIAELPAPEPLLELPAGPDGIRNPFVTEISRRQMGLHRGLYPLMLDELRTHRWPGSKRLLRSFLRGKNEVLVLETIGKIGCHRPDPDAALELIPLAEGESKSIAVEAIRALRHFAAGARHHVAVTETLKRLFEDEDQEIALEAAIASNYTADLWGLHFVLAATRSPNRRIALRAIGEFTRWPYRHLGDVVVPCLVPLLACDDPERIDMTVHVLQRYMESVAYIQPLLTDESEHTVVRGIEALGKLGTQEAIEALKEFWSTTPDKRMLKHIRAALSRLE